MSADGKPITDGHGEFALRLPDDASSLDVRIRARSFAPVIHRKLKPMEARSLRVTPGASVFGYVMENRKPLPGSVVQIAQRLRHSQDFLGTEEIATDENGRFLLGPLGPNFDYIVSVVTPATIPRVLASKLVVVGGEFTTADAGTIDLARK